MAVTVYTEEQHRQWFSTLPAKVCGAAVICVNPMGQILAVKASYKHHWSLPGGVVDGGETPRTAALRELHEEAGIVLEPSDLQFAGVVHCAPADGQDSLYFFFIAREVAAAARPDGKETVEAQWLAPAEFKERANGKQHIMVAADLATGGTNALYHEVTS